VVGEKPEKMKMHMRLLKSRWLWGSILLLAWFLAAYPRPSLLIRTMARFVHLPIEPAAVAHVSATLPDDPAAIEAWVRKQITYDANDYAGWGVVFYMASPEEVLRRGKAPCYGRAVVLASILEDKGVPHRVFGTTLHMWVDYAGRTPLNPLETPRYAVLWWEAGKWHWQGLGWLQIAPLMVAWGLGRFYWSGLPWLGKLAAVAIALGTICWYFRRQVGKGTHLPTRGWLFVLWLSAAPVLVGLGESMVQAFPETELVSDRPFSLLADAILPSAAGPVMLLGVVGYFSLLVVNRQRAGTPAAPLGFAVLCFLVLLTIAILWLGVVWTHWNVIMVQRIGFRDMRPIPLPTRGSWPAVVGWGWTIALVAFALHQAKKWLSASRRQAA
jgi:hypothetical protein